MTMFAWFTISLIIILCCSRHIFLVYVQHILDSSSLIWHRRTNEDSNSADCLFSATRTGCARSPAREARRLNCMPPVNLGLSGIYSKAGRFFGDEELCSVQPLSTVQGNANFPRDLPRGWLDTTTNITREKKYDGDICMCMEILRHKLSFGVCVSRKAKNCTLFFSLNNAK